MIVKKQFWVCSYEHNWGTRFERSLTKVWFDYKPRRVDALVALEKEMGRKLDLSWFDYGPLALCPADFKYHTKLKC